MCGVARVHLVPGKVLLSSCRRCTRRRRTASDSNKPLSSSSTQQRRIMHCQHSDKRRPRVARQEKGAESPASTSYAKQRLQSKCPYHVLPETNSVAPESAATTQYTRATARCLGRAHFPVAEVLRHHVPYIHELTVLLCLRSLPSTTLPLRSRAFSPKLHPPTWRRGHSQSPLFLGQRCLTAATSHCCPSKEPYDILRPLLPLRNPLVACAT